MGAAPRSSVAVTVKDPAAQDAGSGPKGSAQAGWHGAAYLQIVTILSSFLIGALAAGLLFQSVGRMTAMPRHHARLQLEEGRLRLQQEQQLQATQQLAAPPQQCSPAPPKECPQPSPCPQLSPSPCPQPSPQPPQPCLPPPVPPYVARHLAALEAAPTPSLAEVARQQGIVYMGSGRRLQRFASKLVSGTPVTVVTLGGSVTANAGTSHPSLGYPSRFMAWLNATFPHPGNQLLNRGIGASACGLFALCVEKMMPPTPPDMVVLEFTFNEPPELPYDHPHRRGFEKLLRKVLRLPSRPLVVVLHHWAWWHATAYTDTGVVGGLYWGGAETQLSLFAQYYDTPNLSLRAAAYHLMRRGVGNFKVDKLITPDTEGRASPDPGKIGESFYKDAVHPADFGHQASERGAAVSCLSGSLVVAMADLLMELTWQGVTKLTRQAEAQAVDAQQAASAAAAAAQQPGVAARRRVVSIDAAAEEEEGIPPHMIRGNTDDPASACYLQEAFQPVVVQASNFSWVPARPNATTFNAQKWAWTGSQPGAWAELAVDTREDTTSNLTAPVGPAIKTIVILGYLRSYESMGSAQVECVSGCTCDSAKLEGTWDRRATLMQMHEIWVTQHADCRVRVTILPETQSGAHKISLTSLMAAAYPIFAADTLANEAGLSG
ncbi:hypothetical protein N2152v2_000516 [Parachlorella kessleri]